MMRVQVKQSSFEYLPSETCFTILFYNQRISQYLQVSLSSSVNVFHKQTSLDFYIILLLPTVNLSIRFCAVQNIVSRSKIY